MKLNLKSNSQNLVLNLIIPSKKFRKQLPGLIFIHGWKSDQTGNIKRAGEISKLEFVCLTLDLRGHGESEGTIDQFSRKDHLEDIKVAYKYLAELPEVDTEKIGIIGSSYGAYLAAVSTNFLKFNKLALRVPALYFDAYMQVSTDKLIQEEPEAFKSSDLKPENCLALRGVRDFKGGILIVESGKDEEIPHPVIENYLKFIENEKLTVKVMKNATHALTTAKLEKEYIEILKKWLLQK